MKYSFDSIGAEYDSFHPEHVQQLYFYSRLREVRKYLRKGSLILDVGSGTSRQHPWYKENGFNVIGLDPSIELLKVAKRRNANITQADGLHLPFKNSSFDCVLFVSVLHHIGSYNKINKLFLESSRVVKPGGYICIIDHNIMCPYLPIILTTFPTDRNDPNVMAVSQFKLQYIIKSSNHDVKNLIYYGWVPNFIPKFSSLIFKSIESMLPKIPVLNYLSAQYIIIAKKLNSRAQ